MTLLSVCVPDAGAGWLSSFPGECSRSLSSLTHSSKCAVKGAACMFESSVVPINVAIVTSWKVMARK